MIEVLKSLFIYIYRMKCPAIIAILAFFIIILCLKAYYGSKKWWKRFNAIMVLIWYSMVLFITVFSRKKGLEMSEADFRPFHSYMMYWSAVEKESLRSNIMNILLFFPGGFFMYESISCIREHRRIFLIALISICLSVFIEYLQYCLKCGVVEVDDVINNCFGAVLYSLAISLFIRLKNGKR